MFFVSFSMIYYSLFLRPQSFAYLTLFIYYNHFSFISLLFKFSPPFLIASLLSFSILAFYLFCSLCYCIIIFLKNFFRNSIFYDAYIIPNSVLVSFLSINIHNPFPISSCLFIPLSKILMLSPSATRKAPLLVLVPHIYIVM